MSGPPAGLLQGLLLGEKYRIPDEVKEIFRRIGLAHALVIGSIGWYSLSSKIRFLNISKTNTYACKVWSLILS